MVDKQAHLLSIGINKIPTYLLSLIERISCKSRYQKHIHLHSPNNLSKQVLSVIKLALNIVLKTNPPPQPSSIYLKQQKSLSHRSRTHLSLFYYFFFKGLIVGVQC